MITQEKFNEAVLDVTGGPNWDIVKLGLSNDIYQAQAQALDAGSWEEVCRLRGFAQGLAYVMNLREVVTTSIREGESNAKQESNQGS